MALEIELSGNREGMMCYNQRKEKGGIGLSVILLFIDGVGLGEAAPYNPWYTNPTPHLKELLAGQSLVRQAVGEYDNVALLETDAQLGVAGLPQSATGQSTIFTGRNAPQAMGKHQSGFPFQRLREWLIQDHLYRQFEQRGLRGTFANSYTEEYFQLPSTQRGWVSVSTATVQHSSEPMRMLPDLLSGRAVYHDLTRYTLARLRSEVKEIEPEEAACHLLDLAVDYHLVVHEFFLSDRAGHKQDQEMMEWIITTYDRFLGELVRQKRGSDTIVLVSDHGNSEDLRVKTHTFNPVPTLVIGDISALQAFKGMKWDLTQIAPLLGRLTKR